MQKRLKKSNNKMFFGVCGGLGEYFDVDPTLVRILFLVSFFGFGLGFFIYIAMALIMPKPDRL